MTTVNVRVACHRRKRDSCDHCECEGSVSQKEA